MNNCYGPSLVGNIGVDQAADIISLYKSSDVVTAKIYEGEDATQDDVRSCVVFLPEYNKVANVVSEYGYNANSQYYNFDLDGVSENPQLLKYGIDDEYGWHIDCGSGLSFRRKLSIIVILNDDYIGGELAFFTDKEYKFKLRTGDVVVFPSFISHRVCPVIQGCRWALAGWISGSQFK